MDSCILFSLPGNAQLAQNLANKLAVELGLAEIRVFPDGESYVRIDSEVKNKSIILVCTLDRPDSKMLPLMFMAQTLKELGAKKICLVSPYLPYMRQDKRFHSGEAVTSFLFAKFLSGWIDSLITIDPHLHRIHHLSDIFETSTVLTLHATKKIAEWIRRHVDSAFLVGPDEESLQWVAEVADLADLAFVVSRKERLGDRQVIVELPDMKGMVGRIPVLVDDVISTGRSMLTVVEQLVLQGFKKPICIAVHALFDREVENGLLRAGAQKLVSCNTVSHPTNEIDVTDLIAEGIVGLC